MRKHIFASLAVLAFALAVFAMFSTTFRAPTQSDISLADARREREAQQPEEKALTEAPRAGQPAPIPPENLYRVVRYPASLGQFAAYLSAPSDASKHPALIWIGGADHNSLGDTWTGVAVEEFDVFRKAGIVLMRPSLRGGNDNPGSYEYFYGEVNDVLAAAEYLAHQEFVDPQRIYLAGHSTGGTLVLLTAEYSDRFRAVFSLAPVSDVRGYPEGVKPPLAKRDARGFELRSPIYWLNFIKSPVYVFEGDRSPSNIGDLKRLARAPRNPSVHFYSVTGADHVGSREPVLSLMAKKIAADAGAQFNMSFTEKELEPL